MDAAMKDGHSALPVDGLLRAARDLVGADVPEAAWRGALTEAEEAARVIADGDLYFRPAGLEAEWTIADQLRRFATVGRSLSATERAHVEPIIAVAGLVPEQEEAVWRALGSGVSVLTGGPGTGKTTTTRTFIRCCLTLGWDVRIAAPTGKAASRASEVTKVAAETIHRMIGGPPGGRAETPLTPRILVVDEASMCSADVLAWLLSNLDPRHTTRLLLVGDADQLPSVDHGDVLRDLVRSGSIPVSALTEIHRQATDSPIVQNAHRLLRGEPLILNSAGDGFTFRDVAAAGQRDWPAEQNRALLTLQDELRGLRRAGVDLGCEVQVLSPMRRGPMGVDALNRWLQGQLNPSGTPGPVIGGKVRVRVGDRVIQVRNDYAACDGGLFNGEQGVVTDVSTESWSATVSFGPNRTIRLDGVRLLNLRLAWAMTCHRSQGSEFPVVVMLYHDCFDRMLDQRVLYTAITRAKRRFVLIGTETALEKTRRRRGECTERITGLAARLGTWARSDQPLSSLLTG